MDDIDEPYRVIRPRHQERLEKRAELEATQRRNRVILSAVVAVIVVGVVIAVIALGGSSSPDTNLADGDGQSQGPNGTATGDDPVAATSTTSEAVESPDGTTPQDTTVSGPVDDPSPPPPTDPGAPSDDQPSVEPPVSTVPPAPEGPLTGTIVRSCGASGKADCRIAVREGPSTSDKAVGRMHEGDTDVFVCTVQGESVKSTALDQPTSVWARNDRGTYVSMAYLDIPGWDLFETTHPC